jgi:hypothetical protein
MDGRNVMKLGSPLVWACWLCVVAVAWCSALCARSHAALAASALITVLCAVALHLRPDGGDGGGDDRRPEPEVDEAAEFRRGVFELCAALRLGIRFCEQHLSSEPDSLVRELERMSEHINSFVNVTARPVRLLPLRRWPWRVPRPDSSSD